VHEILAHGMEPEDLCVETLDYPFEWIEDLIEEYGLSVCVDVGHLILEGREVLQSLDRYWPRVRILHLHGVVNGKDHRAVSHLDQGLLSRILSRFTNGGERERVVTLEVFDRVRLEESLSLMERI
jgi:sugar phosphate isomerase/epimerase